MCVRVCMCVRVFVCVFVCVCACLVVVLTYTSTHPHTHVHTYMHTYKHTHMHTYTHAYVAVFDVHVHVMRTRFVVGIASSLSAIADIPYLLEVAPVPQRGRVSSSYEMLVVIGVVTSFAANVILTDTCPSHGWR